MKVNETMPESDMKAAWPKYECDFCQAMVTNLWPVNAGLWAICRTCYDHIYGLGEEE